MRSVPTSDAPRKTMQGAWWTSERLYLRVGQTESGEDCLVPLPTWYGSQVAGSVPGSLQQLDVTVLQDL